MSNISDRLIKLIETKCRLIFINEEDFSFTTHKYVLDGAKYHKSFVENGLDSLDIIEIVMEVEREFNIHLDEDLLSADSKFIDLEIMIEKELQMKII